MDSEFEESSDSDMEGSRSRDKGSKAKASSPLARVSSSEDGGLPEETVGGGGKRPRTADDAGNMGSEVNADSAAAASAALPRKQRSTYKSRRDADIHLNLVERVVFTNEELNRAGKGATAHHEGRKEGQHGETMHMRTRTHPPHCCRSSIPLSPFSHTPCAPYLFATTGGGGAGGEHGIDVDRWRMDVIAARRALSVQQSKTAAGLVAALNEYSLPMAPHEARRVVRLIDAQIRHGLAEYPPHHLRGDLLGRGRRLCGTVAVDGTSCCAVLLLCCCCAAALC